MSEVTIVIDEMEAKRRVQDITKGNAKPKHDAYLKWLKAGMSILDKNLTTKLYFNGEKATIKIQMPESWIIHSAPGMKYTMYELIHNGMMADWYDSRGSDEAKRFKQAAELNKAQLQSIINLLGT